jgi:hypothetical protein
LGPGLALARHLLELHGGAVTAYGDGPERGSEFVVRLRVPLGFVQAKKPIARSVMQSAVSPSRATCNTERASSKANGSRDSVSSMTTNSTAVSSAEFLGDYGREASTVVDYPSQTGWSTLDGQLVGDRRTAMLDGNFVRWGW